MFFSDGSNVVEDAVGEEEGVTKLDSSLAIAFAHRQNRLLHSGRLSV